MSLIQFRRARCDVMMNFLVQASSVALAAHFEEWPQSRTKSRRTIEGGSNGATDCLKVTGVVNNVGYTTGRLSGLECGLAKVKGAPAFRYFYLSAVTGRSRKLFTSTAKKLSVLELCNERKRMCSCPTKFNASK